MKFSKSIIVILVVLFVTSLILSSVSYSQETRTKKGEVTSLSRRWLMIKTVDGERFSYRIGRKTQYPRGHVVIGDKVQVEYFVSEGVLVANVVTITK